MTIPDNLTPRTNSRIGIVINGSNVVDAGFSRQLECELTSAERDLRVAISALKKIRDEDYRGSRHESHFIAKRALEEIE